MTKFQASTRDPRDKPSVFSEQAQYKPPHSSWSENDETSDKKVWKEREKSQKTSDSLDNLRVEETNMDGAPEATLKRVPCIRYLTTFREKFVSALFDSRSEVNTFRRRSTATFPKELHLRVRLIALWDAFSRRSTKTRWHHAGYLWNSSRSFLDD